MYGEAACIVASLHLAGYYNIAALDCEKFRLEQLIEADSAPWDTLATACLTKTTLTSAEKCERVPSIIVGGIPAYPLYHEAMADAFFALQTEVPEQHCSWFSSTTPHPDQCECTDVVALKTLGSPRRSAVLSVHAARVAAANAVRNRRADEIAVLQNAAHELGRAHPEEIAATRRLYAASPSAAAADDQLVSAKL